MNSSLLDIEKSTIELDVNSYFNIIFRIICCIEACMFEAKIMERIYFTALYDVLHLEIYNQLVPFYLKLRRKFYSTKNPHLNTHDFCKWFSFFSMLQPLLLFHYGNYDSTTKELSSLKIWISSSMAHELQTFIQIFINERQHLIYYHRYICMWWKSVSDASFITGAPHKYTCTHEHIRN